MVKVELSADSTCWKWTGGRNPDGYGLFWLGGKYRAAHRVAFEVIEGEIPAGLQLDHLCRNRACVNPAHLEPVTPWENTARRDGKGGQPRPDFVPKAAATECRAGHAYDEANTYSGSRGRVCRECRNERQRRYRSTAVSARG